VIVTPTRAHGPRPDANLHQKGSQMDATDKMKNVVEDVSGKAKEMAGKATDDESMEAEGKVDQSKADVKQAGEKVKDAFKD
jgi:uncharacterized protein YjbJ (UPF0337 family)